MPGRYEKRPYPLFSLSAKSASSAFVTPAWEGRNEKWREEDKVEVTKEGKGKQESETQATTYLKGDKSIVIRRLGNRLEIIQEDHMRPIIRKHIAPRVHDSQDPDLCSLWKEGWGGKVERVVV